MYQWTGRLAAPEFRKAKLKLDLHTHCYEATNYTPPTPEIVQRIIGRIKARGLDGIAITEHSDKSYGFKVMEMVERLFNNEVLILPGQEIDIQMRQEVEIYLPDGFAFRFLAHPGYPGGFNVVDGVQGIEIKNDLHDWHINQKRVTEVATEKGLLLLTNSDAHDLNKIGAYFNEISIDELCARSKKIAPPGKN